MFPTGRVGMDPEIAADGTGEGSASKSACIRFAQKTGAE